MSFPANFAIFLRTPILKMFADERLLLVKKGAQLNCQVKFRFLYPFLALEVKWSYISKEQSWQEKQREILIVFSQFFNQILCCRKFLILWKIGEFREPLKFRTVWGIGHSVLLKVNDHFHFLFCFLFIFGLITEQLFKQHF